uniref:Gustatory receptor n=1 Tax=Anopheles dirus TaxID=7168 RepID=A0A182N9H0_9DIPT
MYRTRTGKRTYFRALLANTFRTVIWLSQWCCTVPFPLDPYQRTTPYFRMKHYRVIQILRRLLSLVLFSVVAAAPFLLYFLFTKQIYVQRTPLSIKLMYYLQTAIQICTIGYVLLVYQFRASFHQFYFDRLAYVLEGFGRAGVSERLSALQTNIRRLLLVVPLHILLVLTAYVLQDRSWGVLPKVVLFLTAQLMAACFALLYATLLGTISILLRQMNDTLESILVGSEQNGLPRTLLATHVRLTRDDQKTIEKLRLLQLRLLEIVLRTNGGEYGRLLIMILLATFIYLNTELLQLYQGVKAGAFAFDVIGTKLINSAHKFALLFMYAYPNRLIQRQNLRVLKILYQLNKPGNDARSSDITNRFLTQASLFLEKAHEAYGMISIDMTLILSIVGGLTNILVVLVQFSDAKPIQT